MSHENDQHSAQGMNSDLIPHNTRAYFDSIYEAKLAT